MKRNLRDIRKEKGLYSNFICKQLNISNTHFYRIEKGQGYLTKERIKKLSKIYDVDINNIEKAFERSKEKWKMKKLKCK